jgi:branched-chain amino acid transport system substrate-binding protein
VRHLLTIVVIVTSAGVSPVRALEPIGIAFVDGLTGPFANVGEGSWRHLVLEIGKVNARGGVLGGRRLEAISLDSKSNPQDAILALKSAMDRGYRIVFQGNGSSVALALSDAIDKHSQRNPQDPVLLINYSALDPALTNERCSFWHFRFEADVPMRMKALVEAIAARPLVRRIYLINQDYSYGHSVARFAREMLAARRPDIRVVGDDLHPIAMIKDFSAYVAKIKASGADAVITGNWGNDLNLLVKAARESDMRADFYTYFGATDGAPTAMGRAGVERVKVVNVWHSNIDGRRTDALVKAWKRRFPESVADLDYASFRIAIAMLVRALEQVGSVDLRRVALAMENMRIDDDAGEVWMRADNHQLVQPMFVSTLMPVDGKAVRHDLERTGLGLRTDLRIEAKDMMLPTTCRMRRP